MHRAAILVAALLVAAGARPLGRESGRGPSYAVGPNGMVSTTHDIATVAALDVLKAGGNAADAAAVVQFVLSVVQPQSTGIVGGLFGLVYNGTTGELVTLDGREEAPAAFHPRQFCANPDCVTDPECDCSAGADVFTNRRTGGHPCGVPGVMAAMQRLLDDYGTISLSDAVQPAIRAALEGFEMYEHLHTQIQVNAARLSMFPASAELFLDPDRPLRPKAAIGELFFNPDAAKTFQEIAEAGSADDFYTGGMAQEIVNAAREAVNPLNGKGGVITMEDMAGYRAVYRAPVCKDWRNYTVCGMPMPSSGSTSMIQMMALLERFDLAEMGHLSADALQIMLDAQNIAFADRNKYAADADHIDVPAEGMLDSQYLAARSELIELGRGVSVPVAAGSPPGCVDCDRIATSPGELNIGTTHWSVADKWGNVVAITSTLEQNLGSGVIVPGRGIGLNNELTDFEALEADADGVPYVNAPSGERRPRRTALGDDATSVGGKRPRSGMTPTIIFDRATGRFVMASGSPGGSSITGSTLNVVLNALEFGLGLDEATTAPRALAKNGETSAEDGIYDLADGAVVADLVARGITFDSAEPTTATYGKVQSVLLDEAGIYHGAADVLREDSAGARGY